MSQRYTQLQVSFSTFFAEIITVYKHEILGPQTALIVSPLKGLVTGCCIEIIMAFACERGGRGGRETILFDYL